MVEGTNLRDKLKAGPVGIRQSAKYVMDAARGIAETHRRGILHRDLKPDNILVEDQTQRALVADFGLAKILDSEIRLTQSQEVLGTPAYMPPEHISCSANVDHRGDIYSLGATLYHLLVGVPPFQSGTALSTMRRVICDEVVSPDALNPQIDSDLSKICLRCLCKDPALRYQSADHLASDLQRYLSDRPISTHTIGRFARITRFVAKQVRRCGSALRTTRLQ